YPAPPEIAVQMYNRATHPTMLAKLHSGQSIDQVISWAHKELEGFVRWSCCPRGHPAAGTVVLHQAGSDTLSRNPTTRVRRPSALTVAKSVPRATSPPASGA